MAPPASLPIFVLAVLAGCGAPPVDPEPSDSGLVQQDAGSLIPVSDAGRAADAGVGRDAGAGSDLDAGSPIDAGTDAGSALDAGTDAGSDIDAGSGVDAGNVDAGNVDAGNGVDAGCPAGYQPNVGGQCVDINECPTGCHPYTTCTNTVGSFTCSNCPAPLLGNGSTGCALPPPIIREMSLDAGFRALSLCSQVGVGLPRSFATFSVVDNGIESGVATYDLSLSTDAGPNARIVVTDIASGIAVTRTNTRFLGRGLIFDIDIMLRTTNIISPLPGTGVLTLRYCRQSVAGPCVELRDVITFDMGSAVASNLCDAPPVLDVGSDLGASNVDDWTSDFTPTLSVVTTAPSVTWLRNGVTVGTTTPLAGVATFTDLGGADAGLVDGGQTGYAVRHGTRLPSAQRFIIRTDRPAPYF